MVLSPDQDRVCSMLKDTITLLCKNGLNFKNKFSINALIGVTLDDEDVFLISMNEIVKSVKLKSDSVDSSSGEENNGMKAECRRKRKKQAHHKHESSESDLSNTELEDDDSRLSDKPTPAKVIKGETDNADLADDEVMFIKQERREADNSFDNHWSQSLSRSNMNFSSDFPNLNTESQSFPLSDVSLIPVSADQNQDNSGLWGGHEQLQFRSHANQSSTVTAGSTDAQEGPSVGNRGHSAVGITVCCCLYIMWKA
jgi:hypothetical protein